MGGKSLENIEDPNELFDVIASPVEVCRVENWKIGERVPKDVCDKYRDPRTGELYAIISHENGKPKLAVIKKELWDKAHKELKQI